MKGREQDEQNQYKPENPLRSVISAKRLLARKPAEKYIGEWTQLIAEKQQERRDNHEISTVIFRLGPKWLAISASVFSEIFRECTIHTIPLRSNAVLLGLVNFRGKLALCVNMQQALGIDSTLLNPTSPGGASSHIMMAIHKDGELWVYPVAELFGIYRCDAASIENIPQQVLKSKSNYLRGFIKWKDNQVGLVDEELLFSKLRKDIL